MLVAKGFQQSAGVDYGDTLSPIIELITIRVVLTITASLGCEIRQLDVNN